MTLDVTKSCCNSCDQSLVLIGFDVILRAVLNATPLVIITSGGVLPANYRQTFQCIVPISFISVDLYPDPLVGGDPAFTQRISEMAALEVETVKYEKAKKFRRK